MSASPPQSPLFTPFRLGALDLPNRFVMPAMQRGMCEDGKPSAALAQYYRRRAEGGVPLIIGESAAIDHPTATRQPSSAWITHASRDAWKRCVDEVGEAGGHMLIQLWHEGAVRKDDGLSISPSGFVQPGKANGRAATLGEIAELIEAYTRSALVAQDAGAAGVEVHAAHGYFLDQFLWAGINHRDDGYGGADIAHRARFPAEIVAAIRAAEAANITVGTGPKQMIVVGGNCLKEGLDAIRAGKMYGTLTQLPTEVGHHAADVIADYFAGKTPPKNSLLPVDAITKANVDQWAAACTY